MKLEVTPAVDGVYRVAADGQTAGYIVEAGPVFVSLRGPVYNTSVEVGQARDLMAAANILVVA